MKYMKEEKDNKDKKDLKKKGGMEDVYETTIITLNNKDNGTGRNEVKLRIEVKDSLLYIKCYYYSGYFLKTFTNSFSLVDLLKLSLYFDQFRDINEVFRELKYRRNDLKEYISSNEEISDKIRLIIPLSGVNYESIGFDLFEVKKSENDVLNEYKKVVNIYEKKLKILNFDSRILLSKDMEKEVIKFWISPTKLLKANLLYSFHDINYRRERNNRYNYEFNRTVREFHTICDNHSKILIICKSRNEIFGGYTPLSFRSDDSYGCDNDSFLFSLNQLKKYSKDSFNNSKSIWRYADYGPSFHYDLYFRKNKMNIVKFDKTNYLTPSRWVREDLCFSDDDDILLESLEIFQIEEINNRNFENSSMSYFLEDKGNKIFNDNKDNNIISNRINIDNNTGNFIISNTNNSYKSKLKEIKNTPLNNMKKINKNINNNKDKYKSKKNSINISKEKNDKIEENKINDNEKKEIKENSIINNEKNEIKNNKIVISEIKEKEIKEDKDNKYDNNIVVSDLKEMKEDKDINTIDNNNEKPKEIKDENKSNHQENQESKITIINNKENNINSENNNILIDKSDNKDSDINNRKEKLIENDEENNSNDSSLSKRSEKSDDSDNDISEEDNDRED